MSDDLIFDSLQKNLKGIREDNFQTEIVIFFIESSQILAQPIIIEDFFAIFSIKAVDINKLDFASKEFKAKIENLQRIDGYKENYFYILFARMISSKEKRISKPGVILSKFQMMKNLLNILSLYYYAYFLCRDDFYQNELPNTIEEVLKKIILEDYLAKKLSKHSEILSRHINIICSLRKEQFYFLQKGLENFNYAIYSTSINISLAFSLLISVIENFAQKYSNAKSKWEEYKNEGFYRGLQKILKRIEFNDDTIEEPLFEKIGDLFVKVTHRAMVKFIDFILKYCPEEYLLLDDPQNKLLIDDLKLYYRLRSKYLHEGTQINVPNKFYDVTFNITESGKIKTYSEEEEKIPDVKTLLPFIWLKMLVGGSIMNFINHLKNKFEDEYDKKLYSRIERRSPRLVEMRAQKEMMPGTIVTKGSYHRKLQYKDLYRNSLRLDDMLEKGNFQELISEYEKIKLILENTIYTRIIIIIINQKKFVIYLLIYIMRFIQIFDCILKFSILNIKTS